MQIISLRLQNKTLMKILNAKISQYSSSFQNFVTLKYRRIKKRVVKRFMISYFYAWHIAVRSNGSNVTNIASLSVVKNIFIMKLKR